MKLKTARILSLAVVLSLLLLLLILYLCFHFTRTFFIFAAVDAAAILLIFLYSLLKLSSLDRRLSLARRRAVDGLELRLQYSFLRKAAGLPTPFSYDQIVSSTDNFSSVLGSGSSAAVFKGVHDGELVAVKRIDGGAHGDEEFKAEVAALAAVQHKNLVKLLGFCVVPRGPRFLVYEFIQNGSLDTWLFPGHQIEDRFLPWRQRYSVAVDVARALTYLHHDCRCRVLHLDVKPENILLDGDFRACVGDFGLSKLMGRDESRVLTTVRGTRGYLAPEWLLESGATEKSDVYSFGMVMLEMVGGRRNVKVVDDKWSYFPKIVAEKVMEEREMEVVDGRLRDVEEGQVKGMVYVALWCVQERPEVRPTMAKVLEMLLGRVAVEKPPKTEMLVAEYLGIGEDSEEGERSGPRSIYFHSVSSLSAR